MICDLAEYYHVYDYRSLSPHLIATFFAGLRADSRTGSMYRDSEYNPSQWILMLIYDSLTCLHYKLAGKTAPEKELLTYKFSHREDTKKDAQPLVGFEDPEELKRYLESLQKGG